MVMMGMGVFSVSAAALFGMVIGSFLNVLIYRLPRGESVVFPASHCPSCGVPVRYRDNIPVLGYVVLRGRCRACGEPISVQYPLVEITTGVMAAILVAKYGVTFQALLDFLLACILFTEALIDARYMIIPDSLTLSGAGIGVVAMLYAGWTGVVRGMLGAVVGIGLMLGLYLTGKLLYRREGLGMGDVKLAGVMGLFLGPLWCLISVLLAICFGGFWGIGILALGGKVRGRQVPFGPFLAIGGIVTMLFRAQLSALIGAYLSNF